MNKPPLKVSNSFQSIFDRREVIGCTLIQTCEQSEIIGCNPDRALTRFRPASTFKVLNALIALQLGAIDQTEEIEWDGSPTFNDEQKQRLNLRMAFHVSALWFFQILARRIGLFEYRRFLGLCDYGNAECGDSVDTFWIDGYLMISPFEQLQFIGRLADEKLPFTSTVISAVQDMMVLEQTPDQTLRAKTGYADSPGHRYGWFVGYREFLSKRQVFVTHMDLKGPEQLKERREITEECLNSLS